MDDDFIRLHDQPASLEIGILIISFSPCFFFWLSAGASIRVSQTGQRHVSYYQMQDDANSVNVVSVPLLAVKIKRRRAQTYIIHNARRFAQYQLIKKACRRFFALEGLRLGDLRYRRGITNSRVALSSPHCLSLYSFVNRISCLSSSSFFLSKYMLREGWIGALLNAAAAVNTRTERDNSDESYQSSPSSSMNGWIQQRQS